MEKKRRDRPAARAQLTDEEREKILEMVENEADVGF